MILVFGRSHLQSLLDAYHELPTGDKPFDLDSYQFLREDRTHIVNIDGKWQYHPDCLHELGSLIETTRPKMLVSMLQGEQAILSGLIGPESPFEFYFPGETTKFDESIAIMPFDLFLDYCKEAYDLITPLLTYLNHIISVPTLALSVPPPICNSEFILQNKGIRETLAGQKLAAASWRYRVWKSHALALRTIYYENGIQLIEAPRESYNEDGCLLRSFWADAFHANSRYGHLLLRQLKDLLTSGG
jgi:hypothetical protein